MKKKVIPQLSPFEQRAKSAITFLQTKKITKKARLGELNDALELFERMPHRNQVTWNAMLSALFDAGRVDSAVKIFDEMPKKNATSYTSMIAGLSRAGWVLRARQVFDSTPISGRNVFSWTAMINGYVQNDRSLQALNLFMHHYGRFFELGILPNAHTFSVLLKACGSVECFSMARQVHCLLTKLLDVQADDSIFVHNSLIDVYAKLGNLADAEGVFRRMRRKDLTTLNTMMDAYTFHFLIDKALEIFHGIERKDALSWNIVMSGLLDCGRGEEALRLFAFLTRLQDYAKPNSSTYTIVLSSCAALAMIEFGRQIHAITVKNGFYGSNTYISNSLITMYASFGLTEELEQVFDEMSMKDVISWNSVIQGLGHNGCAREALQIAELALRSKTYNHNTFIAILTSCSHGGFADEGSRYFSSMREKYGIKPSPDHCVCMIDMLGRAGKLQVALEFLHERGLESNPVAWSCLLNACDVHGDTAIGQIAAEKLQGLKPGSVRSHLAMARVYSRAGRVEEAKRVLGLMGGDLRKSHASSWVIET